MQSPPSSQSAGAGEARGYEWVEAQVIDLYQYYEGHSPLGFSHGNDMPMAIGETNVDPHAPRSASPRIATQRTQPLS